MGLCSHVSDSLLLLALFLGDLHSVSEYLDALQSFAFVSRFPGGYEITAEGLQSLSSCQAVIGPSFGGRGQSFWDPVP